MTNQLVSIVISNYNYADYLSEAIASALGQTYPHVEVIVVDDGSTDASREVISTYSPPVIAIFKENGGMGSAFNAGFAASTGEFVHFLDADDVLEPTITQRVVDAFSRTPCASRVQFRLAVVDASGRPTGDTRPPRYARMPNGNLRPHVARYRDHVRPPTSGLVFRRAALERVMPMPEDVYRGSPDQFMALTTALLAPVVSLDDVGGAYRIHDRNAYATSGLGLEKVRRNLAIAAAEHEYLRRLTLELGVNDYPHCFVDVNDKALLAARMVSRKLDSAHYPLPGDTPFRIARKGIALALRYPEFPLHWKLLHAGWYATMCIAPRRVAWRLGEWMLIPEARGSLSRLLARRRGGG